jgi:D-alanyl-lipoteichoic acid acyltransferase DltB (MBOAT superfamily)
LVVLGLFQKSVIADGLLAPVVERIYDGDGTPTFAAAWIGTLAFSGQIFCDFAGYSTCAIGLAVCLGFRLPTNFRFPYAAIGFSDFWRRWHISLSTWLRDYLYISLGGNRFGWRRTAGSLMATMLIGGLWHGASWTFVIWGGLHGVYLLLERVLRHYFGGRSLWNIGVVMWGLSVTTFLAVTIAWVFFRAHDFDQAFTFVSAMTGVIDVGGNISPSKRDVISTVLCIAGICSLHWLFRNQTIEDVVDLFPKWILPAALTVMVFSLMTMSGTDRAFIYFQF